MNATSGDGDRARVRRYAAMPKFRRAQGLAAILGAFATAVICVVYAAAKAAPVDDVIEALGIRQYLYASEEQCRVAALNHARRQVAASVNAYLAGKQIGAETRERLEQLYHTYAREACRLGVEDGLIQRYRTAYAAALSDEDLDAALRFLTSSEGQNFVQAGLVANREALPLIMRRQESQASRAATLLQTRLTSILAELSDGNAGAGRGGAAAQ